MNTSNKLTDEEFSKRFENCTLDPSSFNHRAHIRLAWIYISKEGRDKAVELCCEQIKRFDACHGDGKKFHKTLTEASVRVVYHFYLKATSNSMAEFPMLRTNFKTLLTTHYSLNLISAEEAKLRYLEPDLLPFD